MRLEVLNLYLDGFLGLVHANEATRSLLIEEAAEADSLVELLSEWLWLHGLDRSVALKVKIWFSLNYRELETVLKLSSREVGQLLRNQRTELLPHYRAAHSADCPIYAGLSCFMVEQFLSAWIDSEITDLRTLESLRQHFEECNECRDRRTEYRALQSKILKERKIEPTISIDDWTQTLEKFQAKQTRQVGRILFSIALTLIISASMAWFIWSRPERMPNIYDIHE